MKKSTNRRAQNSKPPKSANKEWMVAKLDQCRSNAAARRQMDTDYRRRPKHMGKGWE
jgi:hypothetical protein